MRHAMAKFPYANLFWYLEQTAFIIDHDRSVQEHIMDDEKLLDIVLPDRSIVPPDSVIKTLRHKRSKSIEIILTQDHEGLSSASFIVRRGEWARFFLDAWYDPLYRSYNFQRAEAHALEHLVQWHGTVLSKLAIVPQQMMNSYSRGVAEELFKQGDFVINFKGCDAEGRSCDQESAPLNDQIVPPDVAGDGQL